LATAFSRLGYNSKSVNAAGLADHSDEDVLAFAKRDRILVTRDEGFANEGGAFPNTVILVW